VHTNDYNDILKIFKLGGNDAPQPHLSAFAFALDAVHADRTNRTYNFCVWNSDQHRMWTDGLIMDLGLLLLLTRFIL
jgi:hypothetical protein